MPELDSLPAPIQVFGVPLNPMTTAQTLDRINYLIQRREPSFFITANLNYAMLCERDEKLRNLNSKADFILADGMPMVVVTRFRKTRIPERVAGSDLIYRISEKAAQNGWKIYLYGGLPGSADATATILKDRYPGLQIVGIDCPPFRELTPEELAAQDERIRSANPDIIFVAFGQPKADLWCAEHGKRLGIPVAVNVGGSFELVSGKLTRAPRWVQVICMEWVWRMAQEPRRLAGRYFRNGLFLLKSPFRKG
jgi:N-acetylglucosaminyldiphosphoundecaprenol N-acetyl-beta-D-mannosaminyltransferase